MIWFVGRIVFFFRDDVSQTSLTHPLEWVCLCPRVITKQLCPSPIFFFGKKDFIYSYRFRFGKPYARKTAKGHDGKMYFLLGFRGHSSISGGWSKGFPAEIRGWQCTSPSIFVGLQKVQFLQMETLFIRLFLELGGMPIRWLCVSLWTMETSAKLPKIPHFSNKNVPSWKCC